MAAEKKLLHVFANLGDFVSNPALLKAFQVNEGVGLSRWYHMGSDRGNRYPVSFLNSKDDVQCFYSRSDQVIYDENSNLSFSSNKNPSYLCGDDGFNQEILRIKNFQSRVIEFLEACACGEVHVDIFTDFLHKYSRISDFAFVLKDMDLKIDLNPRISRSIPTQISIPHHVTRECIISQILNGVGDQLLWTKKCQICGEYYQAKGNKAVFCSNICRMADRRRREKDKK